MVQVKKYPNLSDPKLVREKNLSRCKRSDLLEMRRNRPGVRAHAGEERRGHCDGCVDEVDEEPAVTDAVTIACEAIQASLATLVASPWRSKERDPHEPPSAFPSSEQVLASPPIPRPWGQTDGER